MMENWDTDLSNLSWSDFLTYELIDIREADELVRTPLEGKPSQHVPLSQLTPNTLPFNHESKYLIFCAVGGRSSQLVDYLREHGFNNVYNVVGGIHTIKDFLNEHQTKKT